MIGIYKIISPSGRIYIGSSCNIQRRFRQYKNGNVKTQTALWNSFKKYGVDNHIFEVVEECTKNNLLKRETYYGIFYNVLSGGLNCKLPKSGEKFISVSSKTRKKQSKAMKGRNVGIPNKHYVLRNLTEKQVNKIRILLIENKLTQKDIAKKFGVSRKTISRISTNTTYCLFKNLHKKKLNHRLPLHTKLNKNDVAKIKILLQNNIKQTIIAKKFNITQSAVSKIKTNNIHKS